MTLTTEEINNNYRYVLMAYHVAQGGVIDDYMSFENHLEFGYIDNNPANPFIIQRWSFSTPPPAYETLQEMTQDDYKPYETTYKQILKFATQPVCQCVDTSTRSILTQYAKEGSLLFDTDDKRFYIFYSGEWF